MKGVIMSIEIVLEGKLEKETQREQFSAFLKKQCEEKKLKIVKRQKQQLF